MTGYLQNFNMKNILKIENLNVNIEGKKILDHVSFAVKSHEVHVIMGPNGSGKSTLAYALMGHPSYESHGNTKINGKSITKLTAEKRAIAGLFLAFQSPIAVPGVSVTNLLRTSYQELHGSKNFSFSEFYKTLKKYTKQLSIDDAFLTRGIHDGFSGGEKKKIEMLQARMLAPKFAIFDEIDTGLDVDALRVVAQGVGLLAKFGTGVIIITHYQRILKYVTPDVVHILVRGKIVKTGNAALAKEIEEYGYTNY